MGMESVFSVAPGERQLFLDDHHIADRARLTRTMHRPAKKGTVVREVLDRAGNVVAASVPMKGGDHPRAEVKWRQGHLADLKGRMVSLRFKLRQARLYSYWIE